MEEQQGSRPQSGLRRMTGWYRHFAAVLDKEGAALGAGAEGHIGNVFPIDMQGFATQAFDPFQDPDGGIIDKFHGDDENQAGTIL
ncbi:MAG: hypothetical protein QNK37_38125 [Acidobacteriota bacterium]|nr:hypothetical protein [Acidobacteriota bacterium]